MITKEKLCIHQRYRGDNDGFARVGTDAEKQIITDRDWSDIDELLQRLSMEKSVPVAESFRADTARLTAERASDATVAELIKKLAG